MTTTESTEPVSRFWTKIGMVADIARILHEQPSEKGAVREILKHIAEIVPLDGATLYLIDRKKNRLDKTAGYGTAIDLHKFVRFDRGDGLTGWVASQKQPIVIQGRDPENDHVRDYHDSVMILPLVVLGEVIGVLCGNCRERQAFNSNRQKLMEIVADQVAVSLEMVIYQRELESKNRSLLKAQKELKEAQAQLIDQEKLKVVGELAISVNHEINNPLSIIIGNAQIIELEAAGLPEKLTRRVKAIVDGAKRISLITHKLLKIDRLVTENYLPDHDKTMVNIHKSAGEHL